MIQLRPNLAAQEGYFTFGEMRRFLPPFTDYLVVVEGVSTQEQAFVANVIDENARYTRITIDTDGSTGLLLELAGHYYYRVYGQNSPSNLDPNSADVVGEVELGVLFIADEVTPFTPNNSTTAPDIIYIP
jgi:hypothetical protein